jgi:hypothetical protein
MPELTLSPSHGSMNSATVPEFIDPVFTKTSPKRSFSLNRKRAFWHVFAKTGSIISVTGLLISSCVGSTFPSLFSYPTNTKESQASSCCCNWLHPTPQPQLLTKTSTSHTIKEKEEVQSSVPTIRVNISFGSGSTYL